MLKMDVKYEDFNGVQRNEEFYFNMSKSEMLRLQLRHSKLVDETTVQGGFTEFLESVRERGSGKEMGEVVEDLILSSYGQKSDDGRSFLKSAEARQAFSQTAAYDSLFIQLLTDQKAMETFFKDAFNIDKYDQDNQGGEIFVVVDSRFVVVIKGRHVSREELVLFANIMDYAKLAKS